MSVKFNVPLVAVLEYKRKGRTDTHVRIYGPTGRYVDLSDYDQISALVVEEAERMVATALGNKVSDETR